MSNETASGGGVSRRAALGGLLAAGTVPLAVAAEADAGMVVDAAAHGVVADGVTDAAPALHRAMAALRDGGVLVLPAGIVALGSPGWAGIAVRGLRNVRIQGQRSTLKWLAAPRQAAGPFGPAGWLLHSCRNTSVAGLCIDGNGIDCIGLALEGCVSCTVSEVEAYGHGSDKPSGLGQLASCKGRGNAWLGCVSRHSTPGSHYRGFYLGNANDGWGETDLRIQGCSALDNDATGFAIAAAGLTCIGSTADGNAGSGFISASARGSGSFDHLFQGNHARRNAFHGWQTDVYGPNVERVVITGNNLSDNAYCGALCHRGTNVSICANLMTGNGASTGSGAIEISDSDGVIVADNQIRGDAGHGICISVGSFKNRIRALLIANNRCVGSVSKTVWLEARDDAADFDGIVFSGNAVTGGSHGVYCATASPQARIENVTISNNLVEGAGIASYWFADATPGQTGNLRLTGNAGGRAVLGAHLTPVADADNAWNAPVSRGTSRPRSGTWQPGAIVYNAVPAPGAPVGWVCTEGGTPGTWHEFGIIGG